MGRAPAVALAYMWWVQGMHLEEARDLLLSKRPCHPKLFAIREATTDILFGGDPQEVVIRKQGSSQSQSVEIAGALFVYVDCCLAVHMCDGRSAVDILFGGEPQEVIRQRGFSPSNPVQFAGMPLPHAPICDLSSATAMEALW